MKHSRRIRGLSILGLGLLVLASCGRANAPPPGWGDRGAISQPPVNAPVSVRLASGLIDQRPDRGMRERVDAAGADLAVCRAELEAARVTFTPVPDRVDSETCGLAGAGTLDVDRGTVARLSPAAPVMTCQTALALSVWRRQVVEPAAREIFGQDVVDIVHYGTFACRTVSNRPGARPSAHSRAAAVDFAGVILRDGTRVMVKSHWYGDGPEARFLKRIRDEGCWIFSTVLSPDYDAPHQDHLHLEPGGAGILSVTSSPEPRPIVVFDTDCVLCSGMVRFVLAHERGPDLLFAGAGSATGVALAERYGFTRADLNDTFLVIEDGRALTRSEAGIAIARRLRRPWGWLAVLKVIPRPVRDAVYGFVARHRYQWFGRRPSCLVIEPRHRSRFLDLGS